MAPCGHKVVWLLVLFTLCLLAQLQLVLWRHSTSPFPIDFVYTWVNGSDPDWQQTLLQHLPDSQHNEISGTKRFREYNALMYSVRATLLLAPWVHRIYIVSAGQIASWYSASEFPKVHWVNHSELLDAQYLPTFNSYVLEASVHRIPGLAEHFVYMNDDFFLARRPSHTDLFEDKHTPVLYTDPWAIPIACGQLDLFMCPMRNAISILKTHKLFAGRPEHTVGHNGHPMIKSVMHNLEQKLEKEFHQLRKHKFRTKQDFNSAILFAHNKLLKKVKFRRSGKFMTITDNPKDFHNQMNKMRKDGRLWFVVNDEMGDTANMESVSVFEEEIESYYRSFIF